MRKVRSSKLWTVDFVERLDKGARFLGGDDAFMFAANPAHNELEWQRDGSACLVDDLGRAKIGLMVLDE